jgi:hypothetical protein
MGIFFRIPVLDFLSLARPNKLGEKGFATINQPMQRVRMSQTVSVVPESNRSARFPEQLHRALSEMASEGLDYIASWQPHGRSFKIHDTQAFVQVVLGRYVCVAVHLFLSSNSIRLTSSANLSKLVRSNQVHFLSASIKHLQF